MKNIAIALLASIGFVACQQKPATENNQASIELVKKAVIDSMKMQEQLQAVKQSVIDSMQKQEVKPEKKAVAFPSATQKNSLSHHQGAVASAKTADEKTTETDTKKTVVTKKKKKSVVKGAVIGAGVGAVAGAIINHNNRGAGAVIGGVIGAGAGAATGAIIDKKSK